MNKETYRFMYPAGIASLSSVFSQKALQWLFSTTTDDDGWETGNFILFGDLLPQDRRSIPRNSFPRNGTWAGSAYATCWTHSRTWGLSTLAVQGWHP